jgi:hypothetical protein
MGRSSQGQRIIIIIIIIIIPLLMVDNFFDAQWHCGFPAPPHLETGGGKSCILNSPLAHTFFRFFAYANTHEQLPE